jgi:flagellar motor switch protein FliN/FliY
MLKTLTEIDRFGDVPVPVEVRIGSRTATVREVIALKAGSILELDKRMGATLDLVIGNFRMASAEIVVVDNKLAVRITAVDSCKPPQVNHTRETAKP